MELIGPYLVACSLLVVAGVAKAVRPDDTARAVVRLLPGTGTTGRLRNLGTMRTVIRVGASAEAVLGMAALAFPRAPTAAAVAVSYLAFTAVVAAAMVEGGALAACGCFGWPDTPPTPTHAALDLTMAVAAASVALHAPSTGAVSSVLAHQPWHGVPLVTVSALGVWLAYLVVVRMARLEAMRRQVGIRAGRP